MSMVAIVVILLLSIQSIQSSMSATISCQSCEGPCTTGKCFLISFGTQVFTQCASPPCTSKPYNLSFTTCTNDFNGKNCTTGVCVELQNKGCASRMLLQTQCTAKWREVSCTDCQTSVCSKCAMHKASDMIPYQECLGANCNNIQNINISYYNCSESEDLFGNPCSCCYGLMNQYAKKPVVCASDLGLQANTSLNDYVKKLYADLVSLCVGLFYVIVCML